MQPLPRFDYEGIELRTETLAPTPMIQTNRWIREAIQRHEEYSDCMEPTAMTLATVDAAGHPSSRVVLMRSLDEIGPGFITTAGSRKCHDIEANPHVAASLNWLTLFRAIHFRGLAEPLDHEHLEQYWDTRPWAAQITTIASHQSQPVPNRAALELRFEETAGRFPEGTEVPLPTDFVGYRIRVTEVEFWSGRQGRLHDRLLLTPPPGATFDSPGWHVQRLMP